MNPTHRRPGPRESGFTLVEVIVALGLFVFAITGLMGVIPVGMEQVQAASNESRGMAEMEAIRDDVSLAMASRMTQSLRYKITPPAAGATTTVDLKISENGDVVSGNQVAIIRILGTIRRSSSTSAEPVNIHLRTTWPAKAPVGRETGSIELVSAFRP